jgi:HK97 family phage major capsid protein
MNIEKLKARLLELSNLSRAIQNKAESENRDLTVAEAKELDALLAEFDTVEADLQRLTRIDAQATRLSEPQPRQVPAQPVNAAPSAQGLPNTNLRTVQDRQRWGFNNLGEFAQAVRTSVVNPSAMDQRLVQNAAASTYGSEAVGADGGFSVPPEWRAEIMQLTEAENSLLSMCDNQTVSGNSITFPTDETTPHQSTGGILAYWDSEAAAITQSKPSLKELTVKLHRLTALVPVTEELLEDSSAMAGYVAKKAGEKLAFKINDAIINGLGSGQPLGIMAAPCRVNITKVTSQVAATFHADNAASMMARMPANSFARAVWLINQDVLPSIMKLGFAITTAAGTAAGAGPMYLMPNGLANSSPYGSLMGRPIIITEACAALGTSGDVILADLSRYLAVTKGSLRSDVSIHLWFDQNLTAFRFVLRMNGQPWLSAAIARKNGSNTLSNFVTVETRS